jgi:hypothetical protein
MTTNRIVAETTINPDHESAEHREHRKQPEYKTTLKPQPGQKVYEMHMETLEVKEASYETIAFFDKKGEKARRKLIMDPMCLYVAAINRTNAERHFQNTIKQLSYAASRL